MTKDLKTSDRVDILLRAGVEHPKKWVAVSGYTEPQGEAVDFDWYNEWQRLRDHHLKETSFLFEVIKDLARRIHENEPAPLPP